MIHLSKEQPNNLGKDALVIIVSSLQYQLLSLQPQLQDVNSRLSDNNRFVRFLCFSWSNLVATHHIVVAITILIQIALSYEGALIHGLFVVHFAWFIFLLVCEVLVLCGWNKRNYSRSGRLNGLFSNVRLLNVPVLIKRLVFISAFVERSFPLRFVVIRFIAVLTVVKPSISAFVRFFFRILRFPLFIPFNRSCNCSCNGVLFRLRLLFLGRYCTGRKSE